ncbi:putative SOS response-associated peptidase YoqW [Candidatus Methylobacter favarea]|uniref:Abasic site processing protein n=1 Tax=Candidatus Methylobacter favarea TaxID=2707345 RepID=A0A8S0WQQ5_9GAMM|nr:SOS response-associated peptidase [Candidatus Methylobacter favarea]CAA9891579.1 putative SOS response-associated peptidase YoqW [Candidatus Methylobacter favarea]
MCGRFALYSDPFALARRFKAEALPELRPRYNVAPSQTIPIVRKEGEKRRFALPRWGLIPHWAKDARIGYKMINARAETVAEKPAFRTAFRHRRCLIPADGFYEWQAVAGSKVKQPWFMALKDREPMALAGLWEKWHSPEGEDLASCSIIVTAANEIMQPIHDRMPVILAPEVWDAWLETDAKDAQALQDLLKPYPAGDMAAWPVTTKVNSPRNDSAECLEAIK